MPEHIKMPDVTPIVRYVADGVDTEFSYPFPIFASEDLAVYLDGAKQASGYTITGAGQTAGGDVTFDTAPANGVMITLARELPIERVTDYLEGGDFSAASINTELDYMIASLQQVNRENDLMLRYGDHETPADVVLPDRSIRSNKALGFDGNGDPVAVSLEGSMASRVPRCKRQLRTLPSSSRIRVSSLTGILMSISRVTGIISTAFWSSNLP